VTAASYVNTLDLTLASSYDPAFLTSAGGTPARAEALLVAGMVKWLTYFNIQTTANPDGEIRDQLR
jgi:hypothetical protein